jgi:CubicO group peptidase (beta-lactamase class C family)
MQFHLTWRLKYSGKIFFILTAGCCCLTGIAQNMASADSLMQYCRSNFRFNGVVLVARENKIVYQKAFGKSNEEKQIDNRMDTRFRLGSLSKQFTAFIVLQLAENGKLSLDDPLSKYIPVFDQPGKQGVRIRNLLTHTSGLADYTDLKEFDDQIYHSKDSIILMIARAPVIFEPTARYTYCNSNFFLLAVVAERISGKKFVDLLDEMVFQKAHMQNSGEDNNIVSNEASGYIYHKDSLETAPFIDMKNTEGGGGMYSTADDLLKWSLFFQDRLAKDSLLKNVLHSQKLPDGSENIYFGGWCIMPDLIFHMGHINGFANVMAVDTVHSQTIILLTNQDYRQLYITMRSLLYIVQNNKMDGWIANKPGNYLADYNGNYTFGKIQINIKNDSHYLEGTAFGRKDLLRWYDKDEFFFLEREGFLKFQRDDKGLVTAFQSFDAYHWIEIEKN